MWLNEESWQHYHISELKWLDYTLLEAIIYILIKDYHYSSLMAQKRSNNSEKHNLRAKNISSSYVNLTSAYNMHKQHIKNKHVKRNWKNKFFMLRTEKKRRTYNFNTTAVNFVFTFRIKKNKILSLHLSALSFYHMSNILSFEYKSVKTLLQASLMPKMLLVFITKQ